MPSQPVQFIDDFDEAQRFIKSEDYVPNNVADTYRLLSKRMALDFSPTIRLIEAMPLLMHGERHKFVRKQMAVGIASHKQQHEELAQAFIDQLSHLVPPGQTVEWLSGVLQPLWFAMKGGESNPHAAFLDVIRQAPLLFNIKTRLRDRLAINERIRAFIEFDEATADARLISLGENVLGMTPFVMTFAQSLHAIFCEHIGTPLSAIDWPSQPISSAVLSTERHVLPEAQAPSGCPRSVLCVLQGPQRTPEQNLRLLYGAGEHACLGRALSNTVWSMLTTALSRLPCAVQSSHIQMIRPFPSTEADYRSMEEPFHRTQRLEVLLA